MSQCHSESLSNFDAMDELEDIQKLELLLKSENSQLNESEFCSFLGDASEDEASQDECYLEEVEQDVQDYEKHFSNYQGNFDESHPVKEEELIHDCKDLAVKKLMILNRIKNKKLRDFAEKLYLLLIECQKKIAKETKIIEENSKIRKISQTNTWKLGIPYFKDENFFSAPSNPDVQRKKKNKELFIYHLRPIRKWSAQEQATLKSAVAFKFFEYTLKALQQNYRVLKIKYRTAEDKQKKALETEVASCEKEINEFTKKTIYEPPPLGCNNCIDWELISNDDFKGKHTANECRAFWSIYLHPDIYKGPWTDEEDEKLKQIAAQCNCQNWERIAEELGTGRSGFTTFLHYHSVLSEKLRKTRFEPKEDLLLLKLVDKYRVGNMIPWGNLSVYFRGRSRAQLYHRYRYFLQKDNVKKGIFTEAEDVLLKLLVKKYKKSFSQCSKFLQHRTNVQMRNRYTYYLDRFITIRQFTVEEDIKIVDLVEKYGKNWTLIGKALNRSRANVRHRYSVIEKWRLQYPKEDIKECPRRNVQNQYLKLRQHHVADKIFERVAKLDYIPSLHEIERYVEEERLQRKLPLKSKVGSITQFDVVDTKLREFFKASHKIQPSNRSISEANIKNCATVIKTVLDVLGATFINHLDKEAIDRDNRLSNLDRKLLTYIVEDLTPSTLNFITVPVDAQIVLCPNIHTLIGLRSLLIKHQSFKSQIDEDQLNCNLFEFAKEKGRSNDYLKRNLVKELNSMTPDVRAKVVKERQTFMRRFYSLFRWPSIMSLSEPNSCVSQVLVLNNSEEVAESKPMVKKGRPKKSYPKIAKMNEARMLLKYQPQLEEEDVDDPNSETASSSLFKRYPTTSLKTFTSKRKSSLPATITSQIEPKVAKIDPIPEDTVHITEKQKTLDTFRAPKDTVFIKNETGVCNTFSSKNEDVVDNNHPHYINGEADCETYGNEIDSDIQEDIKMLDKIIKAEKCS